MTTDSLKSFITLPTTTIYKKSASNNNAKLLCFSVLLAVFCVTISCFQIWNMIRANSLQTEVNTLRDKLEEMRKRMGLELLDDLDDFENVYDPLNDDDNTANYEDELDNGLGDFDDDLDDEEEEGDNKKYPLNEDDETGEEEEGSGILKFGFDDNDYDDESIYDEIRKSRKPRAVPPHEGVPIIEESYAVRRNKTHSPVDDYIKELLVNKKQDSLKMQYDWSQKGGRVIDKTSRRHPRKYAEQKAHPTLYVDSPADARVGEFQSNVHIRHNHHRQQRFQNIRKYQENTINHIAKHEIAVTKEPAPIYSRESRVMLTNEDKSKAFRQVITKREYARLKALQQNTHQFVESVAHPEMVAYPQRRPSLVPKSFERKVTRQAHGRPRTVAIHYSGDTSRYDSSRHEHYHGNGLLRHQSGVYYVWAPSEWVTQSIMDRFFALEDGTVTVKETGLYYVYAQVFYKDEHDTNGFVIEHNSEPILQCSTMTHSQQRLSKANTCYTGGMSFLKSGDKVRVSDLGNHRFAIFEPGKSFFGLVKVGDLRIPGMGRLEHSTTAPTF